MSLPTDRWVPIDAKSRPQRSDKVSAGVYWMPSAAWSVSVEGFAKWMHNLVEYRDEYYLLPPQAILNARLTTGRGSDRGIDLRVARNTGLLTGHVSYSLLWADRTFADRNGGATYPARCDNRHKINVALQFRIGDRWRIGATWTGSSGNRITLPVQMWMSPSFDGISTEVPLRTSLNNYRLPFYHRLDLGVTRETRRGYWTISVFNTYCNMNVVAVTRGHDKNGKPVFKQVRMLPVIPSFSYTWIF